MLRSGVVTKKLGMSRIYDELGNHVPVTVLALENCQVVAHKTLNRDGYEAMQLGSGTTKPGRLGKAERSRFAKAKVSPKAKLVEFRVSEENFIEIGAVLQADHFIVGQRVDASAVTIGKGFAGVIKRHNFSGMGASHGVSISHRAHGSTGQCQDPGKVFKGKKMAGHMGAVRRTVQNLEVVRVDSQDGLILVCGAVPGAKGSWVELRDAVKGAEIKDLPVPGSFSLSADPAEESVEASEALSDQSAQEEVKGAETSSEGTADVSGNKDTEL